MTREELLTFVLLGFVVLLGLMVLGWALRKRRQRAIPEPLAVPADPGSLIERFEGLYVSTTPDGEPLNRIAVRGPGFRSRVTIDVTERGAVIALPARTFFIPASDIREVTTARYTIDRVVEEGGLVLLAWTVGQAPAETLNLDSYFRIERTARLVDALSGLVPIPSPYRPQQNENPRDV